MTRALLVALVRQPVRLGVELGLLMMDGALLLVDVAVCELAGCETHWQRTSVGLENVCPRCRRHLGIYVPPK